MDYSSWSDWMQNGDNTDPTLSSVPVIGSQPASVAPTSSGSWFSSLIGGLGTLGTTAAGVTSALTGQPVISGTKKNASVTSVSSLLAYIPLAIAAAAVIGILFLLFRRRH